jgi:hypothetical protein
MMRGSGVNPVRAVEISTLDSVRYEESVLALC